VKTTTEKKGTYGAVTLTVDAVGIPKALMVVHPPGSPMQGVDHPTGHPSYDHFALNPGDTVTLDKDGNIEIIQY